MDIFNEISAQNAVDHWSEIANTGEPYIGETLFPSVAQANDGVVWYKSNDQQQAPLALSTYNAAAKLRDRQGMQKVSTNTQLAREEYKIDEQTRMKLFQAQNSDNQALKDSLLNHIFDDVDALLKSAKLTQEIMRMQMLKTGKISINADGVSINDDYKYKRSHLVTADKLWTDPTANPFQDIQDAIDTITNDYGSAPTRVLMNTVTWNALKFNNVMRQTILNPVVNTGAVVVSDQQLKDQLSNFGLAVQVYDKNYIGFDGKTHKFIDDGMVIFMPKEALGTTVFSTNPDQVDNNAQTGIDVSTSENISISTRYDNTTGNKTKIIRAEEMMIPTFENINGVYVLSGVADAKKNAKQQSAIAQNIINNASGNTDAVNNGNTDATKDDSSKSSK